MKMLRKHIFLLVLLLQAGTAFAAPDRDSLVMKIIERGKLAFQEMARQNRLNDEKGQSSQNRYVLHINTADLIDKQIDVLDKEYIKQRKVTYSPNDVGGDVEGQFIVPAGEDLDDLDEDLKNYNLNPNTKVRAYLITVDFIPMIFNGPLPTLAGLLDMSVDNGLGKEDAAISQAAREDAAIIVKGIAAGLLNKQPEGSAPAAFNTVCCGMVNYKVYAKRRMLKTFRIFSPYYDLTGDERSSYSSLLGKHLMSVKGSTGPKLVEKFIHAIIDNGMDYGVLPRIKEQILSVTDYDRMGLLLTGLSEMAYDQFTYEERIHAIKVLTSKGSMNAPSQEKVKFLLSTANFESDAAKLMDDLAKPNERISKTKEVESGDFGKMTVPNEDADLSLLHILVNGMYDQMIGSQNYTGLTQFFINLARSSPTVFDEALAYYRDPNKLDRTIVWDKSYALELLNTPPAGTNSYEVKFDNKTDEITITKSQLKYYENDQKFDKLRQAMREYAEDNDGFLKKFLTETLIPASGTLQVIGYYDKLMPPAPQWEKEEPFKLKPWALVSFTNKSDLSLLASAVGESEGQKEHQAQFLPAIVLKYAADKKMNSNVGKGVVMAFDVITLVTPVGELAYLGKVANYVYKGVEYGSKVASLGHLAVETGAIPKDSKLGELITECYHVANLMQLGNLGLTLTNGFISKLTRAEATKFLQTYYAAEKEGMMYLLQDPETVKRIIRFKREIEEAGIVAGYGKNWTAAIKEQIYEGISATVAKMKDLKFLKAVPENQLIKFVDGKGETVMHTMADGTLVLDKTVGTLAQDARLVGTIDGAAVRASKTAPEIVEDIMFVQRANKSVECVRGACFIAGTLVRTRAGLTPIEQVKENDTVLGVQVANGDTTWQKVTRAFKKQATKLVRVITDSDTIFSTPEHPYLTEDGWKSAADLKTGWRLRLAGHAFATLTAVLPIDTSVTVYNFETSITHNYCIGSEGIVVHNSCVIFDRLKGSIPVEHFDEFVNDFKDMADVLAKFDNGKLSIDAWEILYKYPAFRSESNYLHQVQAILRKSTDANCGALVRDAMAGRKGFGTLNEVDRAALRRQFETLEMRARSAGNEVMVTDMQKYLAEIRDVWMGEGIAARVAKIGKLADQYNDLTAAEKALFATDFAGASPLALKRMAEESDFLAHWRTDRNYYLEHSYANMSHADWSTTANRVMAEGGLNGSLAKELDDLKDLKEGIVAAASYEGKQGGAVIRYNADAPNMPELSPMFKRRITYLDIIRADAEEGGLLYKTLYKDVPLQKVINASDAGKHAEVMAVDVLAKELGITTHEGLGRIHVIVRGGKYGSMCRCPHCFYILQGVTMIGNR